MFEEVETDTDVVEDSDGSLGEDNFEIQEENSDSEQDVINDELNETGKSEHRRQHLIPYLIGNDGTTWRKHFQGYNRVRIRAHNTVSES